MSERATLVTDARWPRVVFGSECRIIRMSAIFRDESANDLQVPDATGHDARRDLGASLPLFRSSLIYLDAVAATREPLEVGATPGGPTGPKTFLVRATVRDWIDGDTVDVDIRLWFDLTLSQRVRIYGVNTPELRSGDPDERARAVAARDFCATLAPPGSTVQLASVGAADKYGRFLAALATAEGEDLAERLVAAGHGTRYYGGPRA